MLLQRDERLQVIGECASGEEAIKTAKTEHLDIMLMDINMYPMNGLEATKEIIRLNPDIKVIGVSINNQPSYAKNMLLAGAKGYVTKNSSREEMIQAIIQVHSGNTFICKEIQEKMNKI
jgi:DNA-binding NarL/FixJ family response regulator